MVVVIDLRYINYLWIYLLIARVLRLLVTDYYVAVVDYDLAIVVFVIVSFKASLELPIGIDVLYHHLSGYLILVNYHLKLLFVGLLE